MCVLDLHTVGSVNTVLLFLHKSKQHDEKWFHPKTAYHSHFRDIRLFSIQYTQVKT